MGHRRTAANVPTAAKAGSGQYPVGTVRRSCSLESGAGFARTGRFGGACPPHRAGEGVADAQLRRFRADPGHRDSICNVGLWGWSRHPNYFFEWFGWLAYVLFAIDFSGLYPWGFITIAGPLCMYWLLVHVSGIPPLEEHMLERRREAFRAYQARTNAFFPAPPRIL
jgi:hypothetical protein